MEQLTVIVRNDSLRELCDLDDDARYARMEDIIEDLRLAQEAAAEEAARLAEEALEASMAVPGAATAFWPYNPRLREAGQSYFIDRWGDRPLEDDWRRSRKLNGAFSTIEDVADEVASTDLMGQGVNCPPQRSLLESLPCSEEQRAAADTETATAVYQSGVIYKEKLEDTDNAIEAWVDLLDRFDGKRGAPVGTLPTVSDLPLPGGDRELPESVLRDLQLPVLGGSDCPALPRQRMGATRGGSGVRRLRGAAAHRRVGGV